MRQDDAAVWDAGGHDCVREGNRGRQLDQGDVITAKDKTVQPHLRSNYKQNMVHAIFMFCCISFLI